MASACEWTFRDPATGSTATVEAETWFAARAKAAIRLGCDPVSLELVKKP